MYYTFTNIRENVCCGFKLKWFYHLRMHINEFDTCGSFIFIIGKHKWACIFGRGEIKQNFLYPMITW